MEIIVPEDLFRNLCDRSVLRGHGKNIDLSSFNRNKDHQFLPKLINMNKVKTIFGATNRCCFRFCVEKDRKIATQLLDVSDEEMTALKFSSGE